MCARSPVTVAEIPTTEHALSKAGGCVARPPEARQEVRTVRTGEDRDDMAREILAVRAKLLAESPAPEEESAEETEAPPSKKAPAKK